MFSNKLISPLEVNRLYEQLLEIIEVIKQGRVNSRAKGRIFEDEIIKALDRIGYDSLRGLASRLIIRGLSGVNHEHDILFVKRKTKAPQYLVETKWRETACVQENDVMVFNQKVLDIFFNRYIDGIRITDLYRIFVASRPLTFDAFRLCLTYGILVLQPYMRRLKTVSLRTERPVSLPPIDWAIVHITSKHGDEPKDQYIEFLLKRLRNLRGKIFRKCTLSPDNRIHRGTLLYREYKQLVWEVENI